MSKRDPFGDDDEEKTTSAEPAEEEEKPKELSTEPDPNEEPDGDTDDAKEARKERRQNRFKEAQEAAEEERKRAADLERQLNEERTARIATEQSARMYAEHVSRQQTQPQQDPWKTAIDNEVTARRQVLRAQHQELVRADRYDAEAQNRLMAEWQATETRLQEIVTHKAMYQRDQQMAQHAPAQQAQAAQAAVEMQIKTRYPDIVSNPRAVAHMNYTFMRAVQAEGKPNDWNTADQVAAETRRAFKMGSPPSPSAATKARYSGVGGGSNGHAGGSNGKILMTKKNKAMAHALYPDLPEEKAEKKWAMTVGPKLKGDE